MDSLATQAAQLFILAIPIACVSWTVTHEEILKEPREYCARKSRTCRRLIERKLFYLLTCEYCLSHWVTVLLLIVTRYHLIYVDWRGYAVALFALVWLANVYMSLYGRLRLDIKEENLEIQHLERRDPREPIRRAPGLESGESRAVGRDSSASRTG